MRHYSKEEWLMFINNLCSEEIQQDMQFHLLTCDDCMALYSELIDKNTNTKELVPINFTDKVMELIHKENIEAYKLRFKQKKINTLIYYVSAASITLFLMSSGVFHSIYQSFFLGTSTTTQTSEKQSEFFSGWTTKLTEETSKLIDKIN